ncbi:cytochrome P450 [Nocardiopsis coralliicola]
MSTVRRSTPPPPAAPQWHGRTVHYRPGELLLAGYRRRGPVLRAGGYVYLLGPEANAFVFANSDLFRWREAFAGLVPVDGPTSLIVSDGAEHKRRRRLVQPALHHRRIGGYVDTMAASADAALDRWRPGQRVDVYQELRAAIRRSTVRALFGARLAADADFFGAQLQVLLDLVDGLPQGVEWKRRLRTPHWRRAMAARSRVDARIAEEIARVRTGGAGADDHVLAALVHGRDGDGRGLTDAEARDQAVTLIAAGFETTSAAAAWAVYALLSTAGVWERAAAEVQEVLGGRRPGAEDLPRLPYLNGVVRETLRLYPPAVVSARKVIADFTFAGRRVPAGRMLLYSPYVTHRLPELWQDPLEFRPERWLPSEGSRAPRPSEYLPFSAGPHRCIGAAFATTELTVMLARLLSRTVLHLPAQSIRPTSFAAMRPRGGLLVDVRERRPATA